MNRALFLLKAAAMTALLGACDASGRSVQISAASAEMAPLKAQRAVVGDSYVYRNHLGEERTSTVVSRRSGLVGFEQSTGCTWTTRQRGFGPILRWRDCDGTTGTQTSERLGASILPISVGSTESWTFTGRNTEGSTWESTRACAVPDTVSITVPAGTFDAYYVRCEDEWWVHEWYINADGIVLRWGRTIKDGDPNRNQWDELVSYSLAGG